MGTLRELTSESSNVHLLLSNSGKADIYVYDELKNRCNATLDSVYEVDSKSTFKAMVEMSGVNSYLSDKWLFVINYTKVKGLCKQFKGLFKAETSCFLVKVKNYGEYKEFKELVKDCNDLYLPIIRRNDVHFLLKDLNLSPKLLDFVSSSYARDSEKVFELKEKLESGIEVKTQRDIVKLIGESMGSVNKFVFLLLAEPPSTPNGFSRVLKKRIQMAVDLSATYSVKSFKNFTTSVVRDILDIKVLYMQGLIFKNIRDLPSGYDEKKLMKYNYYLDRIETEIPYSRIARLYCMLKESGVWYNSEDILNFIYKYYSGGNEDAVIG